MRLVSLLIVAVVLAFTVNAEAACKGGKCKAKQNVVNRVANVNVGVGVNRNRGVRRELVGNQLLTFDRNNNVVNREFVNNRNGVNAGAGIGVGGASLADRLLGF